MTTDFDVIIIGLGAMGSSAALQLSRNNKKVLGIDRFAPPHTFGSSHGQTRIIREAYFEHPLYVPLVQRAYDLWFDMEKETGKELFLKTGGMMIGSPESELVKGAKTSADIHNLEYKLLDFAQIKLQFPAFNLSEEMVGIWEPRAGVLFPEKCIETFLELAGNSGAKLNFNETVLNFTADKNEVTVKTDKGIYKTEKLIISSGAWLNKLIPELKLPLYIERQVLFWFDTNNSKNFNLEKFPIFIWEYETDKIFYGFPDTGDGLKVAFYHGGDKLFNADVINREICEKEIDSIKEVMMKYFPDASNKLLNSAVCMYTNTPDLHFLLDYHPEYKNVIIASPCSGHGFKFSPAIGEILKDMVISGKTSFQLKPFSIERFK